MSQTIAPRRGRRPQGPKSGKGHVLTTRITAETRTALEEEVTKSGRSLSQVAELWIEQARRDARFWEERLGGSEVAPILAACGAYAQMAGQWASRSSLDEPTRLILIWETMQDQLRRGFSPLILSALGPDIPGDDIEALKARAAREKHCREEARRFLHQAAFPPENDGENEILFAAQPFWGEQS